MNKGNFPFSSVKINTEEKMNFWLTKIYMMSYLRKSDNFLSNCSASQRISSTKESINIIMLFLE